MSFGFHRVYGTQLITAKDGRPLGWVTMHSQPGHTTTFQLVDMNGKELGIFDTHSAAIEMP